MFKNIFKTRFRYCILLSFIFIYSIGCTIKVGAKFNDRLVKNIKPGITKEAEILELFGPPENEGLKDGLPMWNYIFTEISIIRGKAKGKILMIEFDNNGIVKSYSYLPY